MDLSLKNRVALVAGSSRGIGRAIAAELLAEGSKVCVSGRDAASLDSTCQEFARQFSADRIMKLSADFTDPEAAKQAVTKIAERWGALQMLVANLGSGKGTPGWDLEETEWDRLFNVNFRASVALAQAAIPAITEAGGGSIVFISSICGIEATPAPLPYSAAKAALNSYSKNLSRVVAEKKIRVNCVAPGNVLFPGGTWEKHLAQRREQVMNMIETQVPLRRFGDPAEIAALVAFLCSDRAAFITGSCYVADGGQTRTI
jgi:3-oxoacyl-[acyl-carrier protein] reductase